MASTWSQGQWNLGTWNNSVSGASITGLSLTGSLGSFAFNLGNGAVFSPTGISLGVSVNDGRGWSRESWNEGNWNSPIGEIVAGSGTIFVEDGQQLSINLNNSSVTGTSLTTITGEDVTVSLNNVSSVVAQANITITGEDLVSATVNTFAVVAGGAITINTPTLEANTALNNDGIILGIANFINIDGFDLNVLLNSITTTTNNIIEIDPQLLNATANTIAISAEQILSITGNELTISSASIIPNSQNFLSMEGQQINSSINTLKFWDPILPSNTETWSNIH